MGQSERDLILRYLDQYGVVDKDRAARHTPRGSATAARRRSRRIDEHIDLHGMTRERAVRVLNTTLRRCRRNGMRTVLVIHGQGLHSAPQEGAVLREAVRTALSRDLQGLVRNYKTAPPPLGGDGATIVYLH